MKWEKIFLQCRQSHFYFLYMMLWVVLIHCCDLQLPNFWVTDWLLLWTPTILTSFMNSRTPDPNLRLMEHETVLGLLRWREPLWRTLVSSETRLHRPWMFWPVRWCVEALCTRDSGPTLPALRSLGECGGGVLGRLGWSAALGLHPGRAEGPQRGLSLAD